MLGAQSSGAMADKDSERPGIDLANFFRGMDPSFASSPVPDASPCVLLGPSGSGRSSMLFQYALQVALGGGHVLYICGKEQSQQRRPLLPPRLDEDEDAEDAYERIGFKYITAAQDLELYFAQLSAPPDLLIVDTWTDILPLCVQYQDSHASVVEFAADTFVLTALLHRGTTTAVSGLHLIGLMQNATTREYPDMSTGQVPLQTLCLIAGSDDDRAEVRWWQNCPLVLRLGARYGLTPASIALTGLRSGLTRWSCRVEPDSVDPHAVTMTIHKSRPGRHHPTLFRQQFSTASGALSLR